MTQDAKTIAEGLKHNEALEMKVAIALYENDPHGDDSLSFESLEDTYVVLAKAAISAVRKHLETQHD